MEIKTLTRKESKSNNTSPNKNNKALIDMNSNKKNLLSSMNLKKLQLLLPLLKSIITYLLLGLLTKIKPKPKTKAKTKTKIITTPKTKIPIKMNNPRRVMEV